MLDKSQDEALLLEAERLGYVVGYELTRRPKGVRLFSFYANMHGDIPTVTDPTMLAKLVLLGNKYPNAHLPLFFLCRYANELELMNPETRIVCWDNHGDISGPKIKFKDWLLDNLERHSFADRKLRHDLLAIIAKIYDEDLPWAEKYLWWLP